MKYDFHIHTSRYSPCAISSPETICAKAMAAGLTGIALTEHDRWWTAPELEDLRREFPGLTIFRGSEYTCAEGHFLLLLPDAGNNHFVNPYRIVNLAEQVHRYHGFIIWAHPFRFGENCSGWLDQVHLDGIEVSSSNMNSRIGVLAREIARKKGIRMFQNSDAHQAGTLGKYYNEIPVRLKRLEDLADYLQSPLQGKL